VLRGAAKPLWGEQRAGNKGGKQELLWCHNMQAAVWLCSSALAASHAARAYRWALPSGLLGVRPQQAAVDAGTTA
jgi:hypothetical protein